MIRIKGSLDILLEDTPSRAYRPDTVREIAPIIPYSQTENLVAIRGIGRHIDILYKGVRRKSSSQDVALLAVHNFFFDDLDNFRQTAQNAISALNQDKEPFSYHASIVAITRLGYIARQGGVWPDKSEHQAQLLELFGKTLELDDEMSENLRQWSLRNAQNNRRFWLDQLEATRQHPLILAIGEEIKNARPEDEETVSGSHEV